MSQESVINSIKSLLGKNSNQLDSIFSKLESEFSGNNSISDIKEITKIFFEKSNLSFPELTDISKKYGKFLISETSDVKNLDIISSLGIPEKTFQNLESITFSPSSKVLTIEKNFKFGINLVKLKFFITPENISWLPSPLLTLEESKEFLKDVKIQVPFSPSSNLTVQEAKNLLLSNYPNSKEISDVISNSKTNIEIFDEISKLGIVLLTEVNVLESLENLESREDKENLKLCHIPLEIELKVTKEELIEIEKDCCSEEKSIENIIPEIDKDVISKLNESSQIDEKAEIEKIQNFLSSITSVANDMKSCATEKSNATNNEYFYKEAISNNEISLIYLRKKYLTLKNLSDKFTTLLDNRKNLRNELIKYPTSDEIIKKIKTNEEKIITEKSNLNIISFSKDDLTEFFKNGTVPGILNLRKIFIKKGNLITNSVGYNDNKTSLKLAVHQNIFDETKTLFDLNSIGTLETKDYIIKLEKREGKLNSEVWNKFYSPKVIDNFFTEKEQGYLTSKPIYDDSGNISGKTEDVKIFSPSGTSSTQNISTDVLNLKIDSEKAVEFWKNYEPELKIRVNTSLTNFKETEDYKNYISSIEKSAEDEAKIIFNTDISVSDLGLNSTLTSDNLLSLEQETQGLSAFNNSLNEKLENLNIFIIDKNKCLADQEILVSEKSKALANTYGSPSPTIPEPDCKSTLGSDPFGIKHKFGICPGITKNCYWNEYTKILQIVSLMPVPDLEFLNKRLFRYYGVGMQTPAPIPPGSLPTLASGIPDSLISIPIPIIWKHLITLTTPLGSFVVWITLCGIVPSPIIMFIDEKVDTCFLVTLKGPIDIPAKQLKIQDIEKTSLMETLPFLKDSFKLNLSKFKSLLGDSKSNIHDQDDISSIISFLKDSLKNTVDNISIVDISKINGTLEKKRRLINFDSNEMINSVNELRKISKDSVSKIKIKSLKFPKTSEKLAFPVIGPAEFISTIEKMLGSVNSLTEIGLIPETISLRKEILKMINLTLLDKSFEKTLTKINDELIKIQNSSKSKSEILDEKVKFLKKSIIEILEHVSKTINPSKLGFIPLTIISSFLPFPCYSKTETSTVAPYIVTLIEAFILLPETVKNIDDSLFKSLVSQKIDLNSELGNFQDFVTVTVQSLLNQFPDLNFPNLLSSTFVKEILNTLKQSILKIKIRAPRLGIPQITISGSVIEKIIQDSSNFIIDIIFDNLENLIKEFSKTNDVNIKASITSLIKFMFGVDLSDMTTDDIKQFIVSLIESASDDLDKLSSLLINFPKFEFKSIKETLFPSKNSSKTDNNSYFEPSTFDILKTLKPLLDNLDKVPLPFMLVLLGCSNTVSRAILTKIHPYYALEKFPVWEKLSLQNFPFLIWLDQMAATAQRVSGIGSDYVAPYFSPDI